MSRGLGSMQRDILLVCENPMPVDSVLPWYHDATGQTYDDTAVFTVGWLQWQVARLRGGVCETDCYERRPPQFRPRQPHRPHMDYMRLGSGFDASFARALRTLLQRGALVAVTHRVPDVLHPGMWWERGGLYPGCGKRIRYVVRGKC